MIILETDRLLLRTWKEEDLECITAISQDPRVCEFLPKIENQAIMQQKMLEMIAHHEKYDFAPYAVVLKSTDELIGGSGLAVPSFDAYFMPAVEISWRISSHHWNQGYATEIAKALLHYAFISLDLNNIVSFTTVKNLASRRIMEKIGLHHDLKGDFDHPKLEKTNPLCHHVLYRLSHQEYLSEVNHNIQ